MPDDADESATRISVKAINKGACSRWQGSSDLQKKTKPAGVEDGALKKERETTFDAVTLYCDFRTGCQRARGRVPSFKENGGIGAGSGASLLARAM